MSAHDASDLPTRRDEAALMADLPDVLAGDGAVLRRAAQSDIESIVELARDEDVRETIWLSSAIAARGEEPRSRGVHRRTARWMGRSRSVWPLVRAQRGGCDAVGDLDHPGSMGSEEDDAAHLSLDTHRNRGLARRALGAVATWATATGYTLELHIERSHTASIRVAHAAGLALDSVYDDVIYRR